MKWFWKEREPEAPVQKRVPNYKIISNVEDVKELVALHDKMIAYKDLTSEFNFWRRVYQLCPELKGIYIYDFKFNERFLDYVFET